MAVFNLIICNSNKRQRWEFHHLRKNSQTETHLFSMCVHVYTKQRSNFADTDNNVTLYGCVRSHRTFLYYCVHTGICGWTIVYKWPRTQGEISTNDPHSKCNNGIIISDMNGWKRCGLCGKKGLRDGREIRGWENGMPMHKTAKKTITERHFG